MAIGRVITMGGLDISDADAAVGDVYTGKTFYATSGARKTGTMPNSTGNGTIYEVADEIGITAGYHDGTGVVKIDPTEQAKLVTGNIRAGVTVLGVAGDSDVVDTSDANAGAGDILSAKTGYVAGSKVTGTMTDRGTVSTDITTKAQEVTIAAGKHSGSGVVKIDATEQGKITSGNIKSGVTILGVSGDSNVVDTSTGDAVAGDILATKKAWVDGTEITGSMTNRGEVDTDITTKDQVVTIAAGYHNGSGTVQISATEQAKVIAENIKSGITLLGQAGSMTGGGSITVREYTSGATWSKPAGLLYLWVVCVGAGSGGGSGRMGAAGTARGGGSGGGGGCMCHGFLAAASLSSTHTITIGTGGTGGAAQTANDTNGNNGTAGGDSSFGSLVIAKGAGAGNGGTANNVGGGSAGYGYLCTPVVGGRNGGTGGTGGATSNSANGGLSLSGQSAGGGGGGGGINASNTALNTGGRAGAVNLAGSTVGFEAATAKSAGTNGTAGGDNLGLGLFPQNNVTALLTKGMGSGGGGGAQGDTAGTVAGGDGGNGGNYGCGGGGGGGSTNGANSGKGGNGANGLCVLIEFY